MAAAKNIKHAELLKDLTVNIIHEPGITTMCTHFRPLHKATLQILITKYHAIVYITSLLSFQLPGHVVVYRINLCCCPSLQVNPNVGALRLNSNSEIMSAFRVAPRKDFMTKSLLNGFQGRKSLSVCRQVLQGAQ